MRDTNSSKRKSKRRFYKSRAPKVKQQLSAPQQFVIDHMDGLGQGVAKQDGSITFIPKTLPGETVTAQITQRKKGVSFAKLIAVDSPSDKRIKPECEHYEICSGCHYLHTDYSQELHSKHQSLVKLLAELNVAHSDITVTAAPQRTGYRNRIQLHYMGKLLGFFEGASDKIFPVPNCQIIRDELKPVLAELYNDTEWSKQQAAIGQSKGHCEMYLKNNTVNVAWNQPYAQGGFTQVYDEMNAVLCSAVANFLQNDESVNVLELFAGDGNLTQVLSESSLHHRTMIDFSADNQDEYYYQLDLLDDEALQRFVRKQKQKKVQINYDAIVLDPPRKGFANLAEWVKKFKPASLVYVSCNASTMVRDLLSINQSFTVEHVELIDLFPSTYHYETVCCIRFR